MPSSQENLERFLGGELVMGLANVRSYLEWSSASGSQAVTLSPDNAAAMVISLLQLERRASQIMDDLLNRPSRPVGLTETLHQLRAECVT
jgi:hypothetical protein